MVSVEGEVLPVLRIPAPTDIISEDYAIQLIQRLNEVPQAWVYVITMALSRPTPKEMIQDREGPKGTRLFYVEGAYAKNTCAALARLGVSSDFEIAQTDVDTDSVQCLGKLTFKYWHDRGWSTTSKMQWGNCTRRSGVPLGSTKKGAATDALKKCLNEFGWAMDVYTTEVEWSPAPDKEDMKKQAIDTLYNIGTRAGMTKEQTDAFVSEEAKGQTVEELSVTDRSAIKRKLIKLENKDD